MSSGCHWQNSLDSGNFPFLIHCLLLFHTVEFIVNYLRMAYPHSTDLSQVPPLAPSSVLLLCPGIVAFRVFSSLSPSAFHSSCAPGCVTTQPHGQNQAEKPATTELILNI